jgi:6,7-dimethyl-8-ribityllumazine synthase
MTPSPPPGRVPAWPNWTALGVSSAHHHVVVPGALEVPVALKAMADSGDYDA